MFRLPGLKIDTDKDQLIERMLHLINPKGGPMIEALGQWTSIGLAFIDVFAQLSHRQFIVYYRHPIHRFKDQLHQTSGDELLIFLKHHFRPDLFQGLDLIIATTDLLHVFVFNHDGDVWEVPVLSNSIKEQIRDNTVPE